MKNLKKLVVTSICITISAIFISLNIISDVSAITFAEPYASVSGEIISIHPALNEDDRYFIYVNIGDNRVSRFIVMTDAYILGKSLEVSDVITIHYPLSGALMFMRFSGEVFEMTSTGVPGQYVVYMEYTGGWHGGGRESSWSFNVDFNRTFISSTFDVGDIITAYSGQWGADYLHDRPQYPALLIVNGDYNVSIGALDYIIDNQMVINGSVVYVQEHTQILTRAGQLVTRGMNGGTQLAVVYNEKTDNAPPHFMTDKIIVLQYWGPPITDEGRGIINFTYDSPSSWAIESVSRAITDNLVPQELQRNFLYAITRVEFASLVVLLYENATGREITERMMFNDTVDINAQKVGGLGILTGVGNGNFAPNDTLTREQAAVVLQRLARLMSIDIRSSNVAFTDMRDVSDWAVEAVEYMELSELMRGINEGMFAPQMIYTREQGIMTVRRIYIYHYVVHHR